MRQVRGIATLLVLLLLLTAPATADQVRRRPRFMHYESFACNLNDSVGIAYTVALFSETGSCEWDVETGTAGCTDEIGGGVVRFDHGCLEVNGSGACTTINRFDEFYADGGVVIETLCAEPAPGGGVDSLTVRVPDGYRCTTEEGNIIACAPLTDPEAVLQVTCSGGCPTEPEPGVVCVRCVGDDCTRSSR
ncbi:MAG: hypothetical protein KBD01_02795 [Acidobacteria bacterium]|nr:hypothetical protein [Acidobacteriota bacterium]